MRITWKCLDNKIHIYRSQDGGGVGGCGVHLSPQMHQEYIYKMEQFSQSTCCTLAEDLGHLKGQERSPCNGVGRKKEKGKKGRGEEVGWDLHPWWGAEGEERFPHLGKPPHWWEDQLGLKGSFRGLEESATTSLCRQDRVRPTQMVLTTALCTPSWDMCLPVCTEAGCWNMGFGEQTWGGDCCRLWGYSQKGREWGALQMGMLMEETQTREMKHHCWVTCKGWGHHCSLSPHEPAPSSQALGRVPAGVGSRVPGRHLLRPLPGWAACSPWCHHRPLLPNGLACLNHHPGTIPPARPTCPDCLLGPLLPGRARVLQQTREHSWWVAPIQRWGWNHRWVSGAVWLRKKSWNLSLWLHEPQIYTSADSFVNSAPAEHPNGQQMLLKLRWVWLQQLRDLWACTCEGWAKKESELPP